MSPPKKQHVVGMPVFAIAFTPNKCRVVIGGGGGATKAGVKNAMVLYNINPETLDMDPVAEKTFGKEDDGCMSVTVHPKEKIFLAGVNSPQHEVEEGRNQNCRVYHLKSSAFLPLGTYKTMDSTNSFYHQKVARFSASGKLLVTGTTDGKLSIWRWPEMVAAIQPLDHGGEVSDADFDPTGSMLVSVSSKSLYVTSTVTGATLFSLSSPIISKKNPCDFRAARFGVGISAGYLFIVVNARDRKKSYICKYRYEERKSSKELKEEERWQWKLHRQRMVMNKPITSFTISNEGALLAYGSADLSVGIINFVTLQTIYRIPQAHGFPVTALAFSPDSQLIVSGSADGTVLVSAVPHKSGSMFFLPFILLCLLIIVLMGYLLVAEDGWEL